MGREAPDDDLASKGDDWASKGEDWVRNEAIIDRAFAPFTEVLLGAADLSSAHRVLDVGCGTGTLLGAAVRAGVEAVGVDVSPPMVAAARRRVPDATVVEADAQAADLAALAPGDPFDRVVSRFGVMFFGDPSAAFANICGACAPGARLAFVCWREGESDLFTLGLEPILERLDGGPAIPVPGAPGAMAFADGDRIRSVLGDAGWSGVSVDAVDATCDFGIEGSDGVDERLAMALGLTLGRDARSRLEPVLGPDGWEALVEEARADLRRRFTGGPVRFTGHTWLVLADGR